MQIRYPLTLALAVLVLVVEASWGLGSSIGNSPMLGVQVDNLTEDHMQELALKPDAKGLVVAKVDPGPAADAGLKRGDVIEQINHQPVNSMSDYLRLLEQTGKQTMQLLINRRGEKVLLTVQAK